MKYHVGNSIDAFFEFIFLSFRLVFHARYAYSLHSAHIINTANQFDRFKAAL